MSCAFLVPHLLRRVCAEPPPATARLHPLRAVMTGGERLGPTLAADASRALDAPR